VAASNKNIVTPNLPTDPNILDSVSIDCVVFGLSSDNKLKILLIRHAEGVSRGKWGLPGGWIYRDEDLRDAANRLLKDLTGLSNVYLEQLRAFGKANRFPYGRVVTVAYYALIRQDHFEVVPGFTASEVVWRDAYDSLDLIYDHNEILNFGLKCLQHKVRHEPIGFNLLPKKFTLLQLQQLYESVLSVKLDKPNFRRKMIKMGLLIACNEKQKQRAHRAAELYRFDPAVYRRLTEQGFTFEV
jgi:8-oxo-dGTP diphosphatase